MLETKNRLLASDIEAIGFYDKETRQHYDKLDFFSGKQDEHREQFEQDQLTNEKGEYETF